MIEPNRMEIWSRTTVVQSQRTQLNSTSTLESIDSFSNALSDASASTPAPGGSNASAPTGNSSKSKQDLASNSRQANVAIATAAETLDGNGNLPIIGSDKDNHKFTDYPDPVPSVKAQMKALGLDPSGYKFELWDDVISNIGGRYTNHLMRVTFPGGRTEDFDLQLTLRSPKVTAVEMARISKLGNRLAQSEA